ncbi:MAG: TlpA family protein disulfide reductase [Candidatus Eisenbacteria sp.]|nr:TlpA family protein disulfide reductase [Candidatus Eisenbacteria bacterium]
MSIWNRPAMPKVLLVSALAIGVFVFGACGKKTDSEPAEAAPVAEIARTPEAASGAPAGVEGEAGSQSTPDAEAVESTPKAAAERRSDPKARDFALVDVTSGKTVRLSDYRGKVVLIDFWATWCRPCLMGIPHLIDLHKTYSKGKFTVLGISLDQKGPAVVKRFVKQQAIPYPIIMADQATVQAFGGVRSIPTAFLIDQDGYIVGRYEGYRHKSFFEKEIKKLLPQA